MSVTVLLNGYKRPYALEEQFNAIKEQTYKNIELMFWGNYNEEAFSLFPENILSQCVTSFCNNNLGVWARFSYALNAKTKYICILDDDTIPGNRWIEHCLNTINNTNGLIGGRGVKFIDDNYKNYPGCRYESVGGGNDTLKRVDIIGHSWFFEKDWLRYYWLDMPSTNLLYGGEDMHFSYVLQKRLGLYSYIPEQPDQDKSLWASLNASKYGEDNQATSRTYGGNFQANAYWNFIISNGYKLSKDSE